MPSQAYLLQYIAECLAVIEAAGLATDDTRVACAAATDGTRDAYQVFRELGELFDASRKAVA